MQLKPALERTSQEIESILQSFFKEQRETTEKITPSLARSVELLEEFSLRGGKYVRPFLVSLAYELAGGARVDCLSAAAAIELHHKHILILDDISDRDETRYGGPTLEHRYYDIFGTSPDGKHRALSFAMLDGVLLGSLGRELLLSTHFSASIQHLVLHVLDRAMYRDTLAGWQIHGLQAMESIDKTTEAEFIKGLELVTARYTFEGPLQIGLILAQNKNDTLEEALKTYAKYVGTAFQIQDDILGLFGDTQETGKPVGNDVREGKKTLLLQRAYAKADKKDQEFLQASIGTALNETELHRVQSLVKDTGSLEYSKTLAKDYVQKGVKALDSLPNSDAKTLLIELAAYIISRNK